jgi:hypothetical protein
MTSTSSFCQNYIIRLRPDRVGLDTPPDRRGVGCDRIIFVLRGRLGPGLLAWCSREISALLNFFWLPQARVWALLLIAIDHSGHLGSCVLAAGDTAAGNSAGTWRSSGLKPRNRLVGKKRCGWGSWRRAGTKLQADVSSNSAIA